MNTSTLSPTTSICADINFDEFVAFPATFKDDEFGELDSAYSAVYAYPRPDSGLQRQDVEPDEQSPPVVLNSTECITIDPRVLGTSGQKSPRPTSPVSTLICLSSSVHKMGLGELELQQQNLQELEEEYDRLKTEISKQRKLTRELQHQREMELQAERVAVQEQGQEQEQEQEQEEQTVGVNGAYKKPERDAERPWITPNHKTEGHNKRSENIKHAVTAASTLYHPLPRPPVSWGSGKCNSGKRIFNYTYQGELEVGRTFTTSQISEFIRDHHLHVNRLTGVPDTKNSRLKLWIQITPADYTRRHPHKESGRCRFTQCPARHSRLTRR